MNVAEMLEKKYEKSKPEYAPIERTTLEAKEVAEYLNLSKDLIYKLAREKRIPHVRVGHRILFRKSSIDKWLEELEQESMDDENEKVVQVGRP